MFLTILFHHYVSSYSPAQISLVEEHAVYTCVQTHKVPRTRRQNKALVEQVYQHTYPRTTHPFNRTKDSHQFISTLPNYRLINPVAQTRYPCSPRSNNKSHETQHQGTDPGSSLTMKIITILEIFYTMEITTSHYIP